ncbi:pleckstrin homology domain-containing family B member 2-like [Mytilus californianus]|uniref:pleckstrin homology domain-containing family B member 2-like n=1 Tax=Mytilus californianus TaxID=6549 RepID=UPI00224528EB|nr:pleckstrin homology domain-containing family B member 2-like [Mytilus californianus]
MNSIVKSGYLKRHSKSFLSGGWNNVWVVLYNDSSLCVYKRQGDNEIKAKAYMKEVCKRFAYGDFTEGMLDRPDIPAGYSYKQMIAIPVKPSHKAKVLWFLCRDEAELSEWMQAICSTLPQPSSNQQGPPPQQPMHQQAPVHSAPPPYTPGPAPYPAQAPGGPAPIGFAGLTGGPPPSGYPGYPQQPVAQPYPQQPYSQGYPQSYPTQQYAPPPQPVYHQQGYAPPPQGYSQPPPGAYGYQQQPGYYQQQPVVVQQHHKKKGGLGNKGKLAAGLVGGAALGYGASRMMGGGFGGFGGPFGGFGLGHHGSWSSLSSFGSCGSFGSFGSFD